VKAPAFLLLFLYVFTLYFITMNKIENKTKFLHIRIAPGLKKKFEAAAAIDGRTPSSAAVFLIKQYIEKIKG